MKFRVGIYGSHKIKSIFSSSPSFVGSMSSQAPHTYFSFSGTHYQNRQLAGSRISTYLYLLSSSKFSGITLVKVHYLTVSVSLESKHVLAGFSIWWQSKSHQGSSEWQLEKDPCHAHIVVDSIHSLQEFRLGLHFLVGCQMEAAIISLPYDSLYMQQITWQLASSRN